MRGPNTRSFAPLVNRNADDPIPADHFSHHLKHAGLSDLPKHVLSRFRKSVLLQCGQFLSFSPSSQSFPHRKRFPSQQDLAQGIGFLSTFYPKNREQCVFWGTSFTPMLSDKERPIAGVIPLDGTCKKLLQTDVLRMLHGIRSAL